jgi:hypothetical protein
MSLLCRKHVISTVVSEANGAEKSGLATIYPDFSTSAAPQPSLEMTIFLSFLQSIISFELELKDLKLTSLEIPTLS